MPVLARTCQDVREDARQAIIVLVAVVALVVGVDAGVLFLEGVALLCAVKLLTCCPRNSKLLAFPGPPGQFGRVV